jgi:linoleoyl-CoA desaturase
MFFIPWIVTGYSIGYLILGFLAMHMTAGITISIVFQLAHLVEGAEFPLPEEGIIYDEWAVHEMKTTSNFAPENRILSWFLGGLNFQVEHHLFPRVCHVHYPEVRNIVKAIAEKRGVPYLEKQSFSKALLSHIALLKRLGIGRNEVGQGFGNLGLGAKARSMLDGSFEDLETNLSRKESNR